MVTHLTLTFSGVVTIDGDAFRLVRDDGTVVGVVASSQVVGDQTVVTLTFKGAGITAGSLADGRYTLTAFADRIHDATGQALDGDGDGAPGGDYVDHLFRLFGDADGDGDVDNKDYFAFRDDRRQAQRRHGLPLVPGLRRRRDRRPRHRLRGVQGPEPQDTRVSPTTPREPGPPSASRAAVASFPSRKIRVFNTRSLLHGFSQAESCRPCRDPAWLFVPSLARAGSTYQLVFDQSTYQVDPGGQVSVSVYLQEQVSGGTSSVLATDGLISAGLRVSFDLAPLPSDPAKIPASPT